MATLLLNSNKSLIIYGLKITSSIRTPTPPAINAPIKSPISSLIVSGDFIASIIVKNACKTNPNGTKIANIVKIRSIIPQDACINPYIQHKKRRIAIPIASIPVIFSPIS